MTTVKFNPTCTTDIIDRKNQFFSTSNGRLDAWVSKVDGQYVVYAEYPNIPTELGYVFETAEEAKECANAIVDNNMSIALDRVVKPVVAEDTTNTSVKVDYSTMTDSELKAYIAEKLRTNPQWVRRALVALFNRQTEEEKVTHEVVKHNGMGFSSIDAKILSSFAQKVIDGKYSLTAKQLDVAYKLLPKYAGQLVRVIRGK